MLNADFINFAVAIDFEGCEFRIRFFRHSHNRSKETVENAIASIGVEGKYFDYKISMLYLRYALFWMFLTRRGHFGRDR